MRPWAYYAHSAYKVHLAHLAHEAHEAHLTHKVHQQGQSWTASMIFIKKGVHLRFNPKKSRNTNSIFLSHSGYRGFSIFP